MNIHAQHFVCCALKSTSCCQEKPVEQVYLAVCPETPTFLSCLIKRQCNRLMNPECLVSKERDFYLPLDNFSQYFFFSSSQTPRCSHFSEDSTKSSQWNQLRETRLCFVFIITSYVYGCLGSICDLQIFRWLMNAWVQSSMWNGTQR